MKLLERWADRRTTPRYYLWLACLPLVLAGLTLFGLYVYHRGADERRDRWQRPELVLDALGVRPGGRVAEWRPRDGYFLVRLARRVGPAGTVFAVDPQAGATGVLAASETVRRVAAERVEAASLDGVLVGLLGGPSDRPRLAAILEGARRAVRPGGRIAVLGVASEHVRGFVGAEEARAAARAAGLSPLALHSIADRQYLLVLERPAP